MLYIMRHGKTDWNKKGRLQGRTDIPLNDEGRAMAEKSRDQIKDIHLDICYSSPLVRAKETAEIVLRGREIPIITDDRLMEMFFGDYEGLAYSFDRPSSSIDVIFNDPGSYKSSIGGAETFDELFARTGDFLQSVIDPLLNEGKDVLK